jgi:hypothetical protein
VWSDFIGASIILPADRQEGDGRNYLVIGEDVPAEVATAYTAAIVFHNGSFDPNNPDVMFPNGFSYLVLGFSKNGALELTGYYYTVTAPTGGAFQYWRQTVLSMAPPIGVDNPAALVLGGDPSYSSFNEFVVQVLFGVRTMGAGTWQNIVPQGGFSLNGTPRVKKIDGVLYWNEGWASTGMAVNTTYVVGQCPVGYGPERSINAWAGTSSPAFNGKFIITGGAGGGQISLITGAALSAYYRLDAVPPAVALDLTTLS